MIKFKDIIKDEDEEIGFDDLEQVIKFGDIVCYNTSYGSKIGIAYGVTPASNIRTYATDPTDFVKEPDKDDELFYPEVFDIEVYGRTIIKLPAEHLSQMLNSALFNTLMIKRAEIVELKNSKNK